MQSRPNFIIKLKAFIDRKMKAAGYSTSSIDEKFMKFIESIEDAEDYLFAPSPQPSKDVEAAAKDLIEKVANLHRDGNPVELIIEAQKLIAGAKWAEQKEATPVDGGLPWIKADKDPDKTAIISVGVLIPMNKG